MRSPRVTGTWLAAALAAEKLDEFGNAAQSVWSPRQSLAQPLKPGSLKHKRAIVDDGDIDVDNKNFAASSTEGLDDNSEIMKISNEEMRLCFGTPYPTNFTLQMADMLPSKTIPINSKIYACVLKAKAKVTTAPQDDNTSCNVLFKPSLSRATTLLSESSFQNHPPKVHLFNLTSHVFLPKP